ncbi:MAG: PilZ domain-containing protein [Syntrophobacteraceae bacterium]
MAGSKLVTDKRKAERFKVAWNGTLTCLFPNHEEDVEVRVTEVSTAGARLELKTLKVGPHHIVIGSESSRFTLKVSLPEGAIWTPVRIVWYSTDQEKDSFNLGVMFLHASEELLTTIKRLLADVAPGNIPL